MGATFASTLLGFMREVVSARYYGTRWEMDTFLAAATIPTILFGVFNGALVSVLVPTFSEYLAHRKEEATAAVPDEWVDLKSLVGPPARIKERFRAWEDSGATGVTVRSRQSEAIEIMAEAARLN